jgi:DNA-binding Lrp family transcriptional regulator
MNDGWWDEMDEEILTILEAGGPMDPVDVARALGMSPAAVCSCLAMLSADGKVRIRSVEAAAPGKLSDKAA